MRLEVIQDKHSDHEDQTVHERYISDTCGGQVWRGLPSRLQTCEAKVLPDPIGCGYQTNKKRIVVEAKAAAAGQNVVYNK